MHDRRKVPVKSDQRSLFIRQMRQASMTVESAVIVPMTVMLLALLLILTFYVHNRTLYTCPACETAVRGNMPEAEGSHEAEESARKLAQQRIADQVMPGSAPKLDLTVERKNTSVTYSGQTYAMFHRVLTPFQVKVQAKQICPEKYVRLLWSGGSYHAD